MVRKPMICCISLKYVHFISVSSSWAQEEQTGATNMNKNYSKYALCEKWFGGWLCGNVGGVPGSSPWDHTEQNLGKFRRRWVYQTSEKWTLASELGEIKLAFVLNMLLV